MQYCPAKASKINEQHCPACTKYQGWQVCPKWSQTVTTLFKYVICAYVKLLHDGNMRVYVAI